MIHGADGIDDDDDGNVMGLLWLLAGVKFNVQLSMRKSSINRFWYVTVFETPATEIEFPNNEKKGENIRQTVIEKMQQNWCET